MNKDRINEILDKINPSKSNNNDIDIKYLINRSKLIYEISKKTIYDQKNEEDKFLKNFENLNVNIKFIELDINSDYIYWGGTIDGIIQFVYIVTDNDKTSEVYINYLDGFSSDSPENKEIVNIIRGYYTEFCKYWQKNLLQN